jgi:hypothetical protein
VALAIGAVRNFKFSARHGTILEPRATLTPAAPPQACRLDLERLQKANIGETKILHRPITRISRGQAARVAAELC